MPVVFVKHQRKETSLPLTIFHILGEGSGVDDSDVVMANANNYLSDYQKRKANGAQRTDSANRRMGAAAAAYHA